jgi:hypothetical protein
MSTPKGYRPASPERIAERIAWANAVALGDDEDGAARAVLVFAAEYADANDQIDIDMGDPDPCNDCGADDVINCTCSTAKPSFRDMMKGKIR